MEATTIQDRLTAFQFLVEGRVAMFRLMTATMAVMLLAAIFVPIVHKTFLKRRTIEKKINNPFIVR